MGQKKLNSQAHLGNKMKMHQYAKLEDYDHALAQKREGERREGDKQSVELERVKTCGVIYSASPLPGLEFHTVGSPRSIQPAPSQHREHPQH